MDERPKSPAQRKRRRRTRVAQTAGDIPAVTLISIGLGTHSGRELMHELTSSDTIFEVFDLRGRLVKDPQTVVLHKETGADARVQRIVIGQEGYDDIVTEAFFSVTLEHVMVVVMACHSGHHRADTAANHLKDLVNSVHDARGRRLFNCQLFAVGLAANLAEAQKTMTNACNWSHDAWELVAAPSAGKQHLYGYTAASCDEAASQRWHQVLQARDSKFPYCDVRTFDRVVVAESDKDTPEVVVGEDCAEDVVSPTAEEGVCDGDEVASVDGPIKPILAHVAPDDPRTPPWRRQFDQTASSSHHEAPLEHDARFEAWETTDDEAPLAAWETTDDFDVRRWKSVLDEFEVDKHSYRELLLLAQYSADGNDHANKIVGKLLKKASDNEVILNASAFVHACVMQSRYKI
jgi:hypothetical protein